MQEKLTDRRYWVEYWANYQYEKIPSRVVYEDYLPLCQGASSFIEIGGFPGINALYFYKHVCPDVSLLDFYCDREMVNELERRNGIPCNTVKCLEADFFQYTSDRKYDIVFSHGFIEHFQDTADVIARHVRLLSDSGRLLIVLPNFRGMNGGIQWLFDRQNLKAHHLQSMDVKFLRRIAEDLGLKEVKVEYTRKPVVWLEPKPCLVNRIFRLPVRLLSYALKLFPVKGRLLSPYILLTARK